MTHCYRVWYRCEDDDRDCRRAWLIDAHSTDDAADACIRHYEANGQMEPQIVILDVDDLDATTEQSEI